MQLLEYSQNPDYTVEFTYEESRKFLTLRYTISGPIPALDLTILPQERALSEGSDLWKRSCFECFFFSQKNTSYTELNFNLEYQYTFLAFETYRKSAPLKPDFKMHSITSKILSQSLHVHAKIELPIEASLRAAPAVILIPKHQNPLYFALKHEPPRPDFHSRKAADLKGFQLLT